MTGKVMTVLAPHATDETIGVSVRGYTMGAIRDGWIVFFKDRKSKPHEGLQDELCVVKTIDGRLLLRFVKKARRVNRWDLVSVTGDPIIDAELAWAEPVDYIQPHKLTEDDIAALAEIPAGDLLNAA